MKNPYEDIINLPHPTSSRHPRMPASGRAAQFSVFAALEGYEAAVEEAGRYTERKIELSEEEQAALDAKLRLLAEQAGDRTAAAVTVMYFQPDGGKEGGVYLTATGTVKKVDANRRVIVLEDGQRIPIKSLLDIGWS